MNISDIINCIYINGGIMIEKQFIVIGEEYVGYMQGNAYIISNGECKFSLWESKEDVKKVCNYLNKLVEENKKLQTQLSICQ